MGHRRLNRLFVRFRDNQDGAALAAVFDATSRDLLQVACHLVRNPSDAEDLVQSTFLKAITKSSSYDGESPVQGWLYGILWKEAAKLRRTAARVIDPRRLGERLREEPLDVLASEELPVAVSRAIDNLPKRYREVLAPLIRDEDRPEEIARRLGRSPGTVRSQIHRGMEHLRRALPPGLTAYPAIGFGIRGLPEVRALVLRSAGFSPATVAASSPFVLKLGLGGALVSKTMLTVSGTAIALIVGAWIAAHNSSHEPDPQGARLAAASAPPGLVSGIAHNRSEGLAVAGSAGSASERDAVHDAVAPSPPDAVEYWLGRFNEAPADWRNGLKVESEIARLEPDEALRIMTAVWPQLSVAVKEITPKAFTEVRLHAHALKLLNLMATDPAVSVQNRAFIYLQRIAFQDFAEDYEGYLRWAARYDEMPVKEVIAENAKKFVAGLRSLTVSDLQGKAKSLELMHLDSWDATRMGIELSGILKDAGGLQVLETLLQDGDPKARRLALQWSEWMRADETWLRAWVLPSIDHPEVVDLEQLYASLTALGRSDCGWARDPILAYLARPTEGEIPAASAAAHALADIGDPAAVPALIEVLLHDRTGKLGYDIGYHALSKLTGVSWQESYDGMWWLDWWEKNKMRFPPGVWDTAIRK